LPDCPWLSSTLFAAKADGPWPATGSAEPAASEGAQTQHPAAVGGGGGTFLVQFSHGARLGHRGLDAPARAALSRSVEFESRRRVAFRSPASRSRQRQQTSLPAAGAGNYSTAQSLPAAGTARSLHRRTICLAQRTRARSTDDPGGITFVVPLPSPDHWHPARQPSSVSSHLCLRHGTRRDELARAHAADGSRRHPDHAALCAGHPTRRLPAVCPRCGAAPSPPSEDLLM